MKDQLQTIRAGLETATCYTMLGVDAHSVQTALTALSELERMAGEPVADINVRPSESGGTIASVFSHKLPVGSWLVYRATPPAQQPQEIEVQCPVCSHKFHEWPGDKQPQARADFNDEWTGYLKDGETPFERFLRERKDLNALTKLYQRALEENERLKAQQPQADSLESLLSTAIGLLMGYEDRDGKGGTRNPYKPGSAVANFVAECVERLKDWPLTTPTQQPQAEPDDEILKERDDAEDFIDMLLDEVLGTDRPEWTSAYGRDDALRDVQERMTALHKPMVDKAWARFEKAQQPQAKPHKPLFADLIAQHPGLREELLEMDKQPQAEAVPKFVWGYAVRNPKEPGVPHKLAYYKTQADAQACQFYCAEIIPLVAAAPQQAVAVPTNCTECRNTDSWGVPDQPVCRSCRAGSAWEPLNKSSVNPNKKPQAEAASPDVVRDAERWRTFLATRPANTHAAIIQAIDDAAVRKGGGV